MPGLINALNMRQEDNSANPCTMYFSPDMRQEDNSANPCTSWAVELFFYTTEQTKMVDFKGTIMTTHYPQS